jgi:photosystem II stability/assembly factor-like uncharacterized protein
MAFWDRDHGIALGDPVEGRFELLTTTDGGVHWTHLPTPSRPQALPGEGAFAANGSCIAVYDDSNVWFATGGSGARVFRSSDRGQTWRVAETPIVHGPSSAGIFSITFRNAQDGVIAGGDYQHPDADGENLAITNDGGATWKPLALHPQYYFSGVTYLDPNREEILAVGSSRALRIDLAQKKVLVSDALSMNSATRIHAGEAIAVGPKGQAVRFVSSEKP